MRAEAMPPLALLLIGTLLCGCGAVASLTRPEGDGGWSPERRSRELAQRAAAAGADFGPAVSAPPPKSEPPANAPLDLRAALALAAQGNRRIRQAELELAATRERVFDVRGRLLPTTTAGGRYTWYTDPQTNQIDLPPAVLEQFGGTAPVVKVRDAQAGQVNGTLTLPFDLSGEIRQTLHAAQAGYRGERARLWATTLQQQLEVVRSYFDLLEAQRLREVTEQTVALDRQQLANAQSKFDNGRVTKNELLVVQVALRDAEQLLLRRDLAIKQARRAFNETVGLPIDAATELIDVHDRPKIPSAEDALRLSYQHNPVLVSLLEEQQRLEALGHSLERSRLPRFSGGGAIDYSSSDLLQPQDIGSGFVGFTWDLGTDTRREAQIAEARLKADRNRVALEAELRSLEKAVRATQEVAEERLTALRTADAAVAQAEENLRIRQQQFDVGRATSDDVLDAQALLSVQRASRATALYQAHTRRAELQELMGMPLDEGSAPAAISAIDKR